MRYVFVVSSVFLLFSCAKQRIVNRLDGRWNYTKIFLNNGSYVSHTEVYEFTGGDRKTSDLPFVIYGTDTVQGIYRVTKKNIIQVKTDLMNESVDWLVEDMDNHSLVVRVSEGVMFLDKQ
ncbi:hypothetical protein [Fluviicola sp.]|jgi:hypothetical protein|uniref:hypothetical protein n=1 Tax=Fluviicola sp. TaxID=1917219 RepID=UPI00283038C5|nr:hypothetical protein [Fluviicola sp.]MDR0801005.1 hypothetical protein [Fluviicola sp.]